MSFIQLNHVSKDYEIVLHHSGIKNVLKNIFSPDRKTIHAIKDISFEIERGEIVGLIGENGAGKSTTLKMLSGILVPTSGEVIVSGISPYLEREKNAYNIGVIFGQKSRLNWNLPIIDSFELSKEIYSINTQKFKANVDMFVDMLQMQDFCSTPVRQLSLGQRMKAEVALALLHDPPIFYLDEPTIGLDVLAKKQIREFVKERNRIFGTTIILTSHDMKDIESICKRIIMLSDGCIIFDDSMKEFKQRYIKEGLVEFTYSMKVNDKMPSQKNLRILEEDDHKILVSFLTSEMTNSQVFEEMSRYYEINDFSVKNPDIEDVVRCIYEKEEIVLKKQKED